VRISGNYIRDVVQGIHVGLSHRELHRGTPDVIDRLAISENTVHILLLNTNRGERHAIFVGSCASVSVTYNYAYLHRIGSNAMQAIEGLRLFGAFGRRILIRGNHFADFNNGIYLRILTTYAAQTGLQWVIDDNFAESATGAVINVDPLSFRSRIRGVMNNYA